MILKSIATHLKAYTTSVYLLLSKHYIVLAILIIGLLSFGLRARFILNTGGITPSGDAGLYWQLSREFRNVLCTKIQHCEADEQVISRLSNSASDVFITRTGIMPIVFGSILSFQPRLPQPQAAYMLVASMDAIVCVLMIITMLRWGGPTWVAILAAFFQAIYIPAITSSGTLLQHNSAAFFLILIVFAYTFAFTSERRVWIWIALATISTFFIGFLSLTTRPLIWIIPIVIIGLSFRHINAGVIRKAQIVSLSIVVAILFIVSSFLGISNKSTATSANDIRSVIFTGLTASGTARGQTTPMSFVDIWPPNSWPALRLNRTTNLFSDFSHDPIEFTKRLGYSIWANWVYPDYIFFQTYVLDPDQQKLPHALFVLLGFIGIALLASTKTSYQPIIILIIVITLFLSLIYGMISIEPRRLAALAPFLAFGLAYFIFVFLNILYKSAVVLKWIIFLWVTFIVSLITPVSWLIALIPIIPIDAFKYLTFVRLLLLTASCLALVQTWKLFQLNFTRPISITILAIVIITIGSGSLQDTEWRSWSLKTDGIARQQIYNFTSTENTWPWLIIDVGNWRGASELTTDLIINVNGVIIKNHGIPMSIWSAGKPAIWEPYGFYIAEANFQINPQYWYAVPVPPSLVKDESPLTVEIYSPNIPLTMGGDYLDENPDIYIGPSFDPWFTGQSLWRWIWNANDPRIPKQQSLNEVRYVSSYTQSKKSEEWITKDLSEMSGQQSGLFRIFLLEAPFGPTTNVLTQMPAGQVIFNPVNDVYSCLEGKLISIQYPNFPFVCQLGKEAIVYYAPKGQRITESSLTIYNNKFVRGTQVENIQSAWGKIEVINILTSTFMATMSAKNGQKYSVLFYVEPTYKN